ncbi:hypothetical protein K1T71_004039 [Dendrolimus kikuchii]|uniref:Uncharacterized protein n=1 Tax=Dendrolimus kikuchii TaxID=765133 RepID=A0ACC1D9X8_9NEOP|nr:hypothetical protein K1T71_004039 [Dendrolimus kikuchii]
MYITILFTILCSLNEATFKSNDVHNHLGSRTPYRFRFNKNDTKIKYPNCKDAKIWMLVRHGTRLPSDTDVIGMNTTLKDLKFEILLYHQLGQGELSEKQLSSFEEWSPNVDIEHNKFLTTEGEEELLLLAQRMQKRFPGAIKHKYSNNSFLFKYTATQRAQESARHFANGLFTKKDTQDVVFAPAAKIEPVIRFYKHCDKWQKQIKKNPNTYREQKLFAVSKEMNKTMESVSKRLGFNSVLGLDTVNLMYKVCGFETSWYKHHESPWCYAFDSNDAQVNHAFIKTQHYDPITLVINNTVTDHDLVVVLLNNFKHEKPCEYMKKIDFTKVSKIISETSFTEVVETNKDGPNATFLFAHSGTILKILSHIGLYKPEFPLKGDTLVKNRPWKSSFIDCFAANLAFVLFKCKDGEHVLALHQEHIIKLPMCEKELCSLKYLMKHFHDSIYDCDYSDMCSLESNKSTKDEL